MASLTIRKLDDAIRDALRLRAARSGRSVEDEVRVILVNTDPMEPYTVHRGDRIAQLVIQRFEVVEWAEVDDLDETERGVGGWGSTG